MDIRMIWAYGKIQPDHNDPLRPTQDVKLSFLRVGDDVIQIKFPTGEVYDFDVQELQAVAAVLYP